MAAQPACVGTVATPENRPSSRYLSRPVKPEPPQACATVPREGLPFATARPTSAAQRKRTSWRTVRACGLAWGSISAVSSEATGHSGLLLLSLSFNETTDGMPRKTRMGQSSLPATCWPIVAGLYLTPGIASRGRPRYPFRHHLPGFRRRGEVAGMRWDELDLDAGLWNIAGAHQERSAPPHASGLLAREGDSAWTVRPHAPLKSHRIVLVHSHFAVHAPRTPTCR
jgi:integrase